MAIKLGGDTNITLTNTSFSCNTGGGDPAMIVSLFTAASAGNYHFEGNFTGNSTMTVALSINGANKEIWIVIGTQNGTYDFTAEVGDVITLEAAGSGSGSNLSVVRYADEIKEIYVGEGNLVDDYSAMRGPCPEGFHVPMRTESQALYNAVSSLGLATTGDTYKTYLKIPIAGYRMANSTISAYSQGSMGYYRLCTYAEGTTHYPYRMRVLSSSVAYSDSGYAVHGYPIRPFKDEPVIPDSSWTEIFRMSGTPQGMYVGIYHNPSLGIISISDNTGGNWITIADKNLGATTVYNSGDTLSQSNCGNYFQRGNNYGFPRTGTISNISSTQVDTTGYGPGNFYSDSMYRNTDSNDWFNPVNPDLRGGVTGVQQKHIGNVTEVYVGTTKVRPE